MKLRRIQIGASYLEVLHKRSMSSPRILLNTTVGHLIWHIYPFRDTQTTNYQLALCTRPRMEVPCDGEASAEIWCAVWGCFPANQPPHVGKHRAQRGPWRVGQGVRSMPRSVEEIRRNQVPLLLRLARCRGLTEPAWPLAVPSNHGILDHMGPSLF